MTLVIVGAGAAGLSALQAIRGLDKKTDTKIISREKEPLYSLCALPFNISSEIADEHLQRFGKDYLREMKAELVVGEVSGVSPSEKSVVVKEKDSIPYEKLLIASGSSPIVPRIEGVGKSGVYPLGSVEDAHSIRQAASRAKKVVVIGAGFVGLEVAIALRKIGKDVTVVEMLDSVLPRMLDKDVAAEVQRLLEENGIDIILGDQVTDIIGGKKVSGVTLREGEIDCDVVILGIGVRPNIGFLEGSGVKTNMGVLVDDEMRTSVPGIFAAGDVVEAYDPFLGEWRINAIWPNAIQQGRVAGINMAGGQTRYSSVGSINIINVFDVPVIAIGYPSSMVKDAEPILVERESYVRKLVVKEGKLIGMQSVGGIRNVGFILSLMNKGEEIGKLEQSFLGDKFSYPLLAK